LRAPFLAVLNKTAFLPLQMFHAYNIAGGEKYVLADFILGRRLLREQKPPLRLPPRLLPP